MQSSVQRGWHTEHESCGLLGRRRPLLVDAQGPVLRVKDPFCFHTDRQITDKGVNKISSGLLPVGTILSVIACTGGLSRRSPGFQRRSTRASLPWSATVRCHRSTFITGRSRLWMKSRAVRAGRRSGDQQDRFSTDQGVVCRHRPFSDRSLLWSSHSSRNLPQASAESQTLERCATTCCRSC